MLKLLKWILKKIMWTLVVLAVFAMMLTSFHIWDLEFNVPSGEGDWQSTSPDGRFTMTGHWTGGVYRLVPIRLGGGALGSGKIILSNAKTGEILQVIKVHDAEDDGSHVHWYENEVSLVGDDGGSWPLPPPAPDVKPAKTPP
jgi:hypothetical protein